MGGRKSRTQKWYNLELYLQWVVAYDLSNGAIFKT